MIRLIRRPLLAWEAVGVAWAFRSRRGFFPSRALLRWRIATAYGDPDTKPPLADLVAYLGWRRRYRRGTGGRS